MKTEIKAGANSVNIHAYTFEAIHKGDFTEKVIYNFDHLEKIPGGLFSSFTFHIGAYDYSIKLNRWKITRVKETIEDIEKNNKNQMNKYNFKILKDAVIAIDVTVCELEFLPFNLLILHFELNPEKLLLSNSYKILSALLRTLEDYWLTFAGIFSSEYKRSFAVPSFFQIRYDNKIKSELNKIMTNLQKYSKDIVNVEKYIESSHELKKYFLLENLESEEISMLKVQNDYYILGKISMSGSDFATVFSLEPNEYSYSGSNPFFGTNPLFGVFPALFLPYLLLVIPILWWRISHQKIKEYISTINQFKITYKTQDYLKDDNKNKFSQILDLDNELNFLLSELNDLQKMNKIFNNHFLESPEVIDKSIVLDNYEKKKEKTLENKIKYSYVKICNQSFVETDIEIKKYAVELQNELSLIKKRIEILQNKQENKIKSYQNKILTIVAILTGIFAGIVGIDVIIKWLSSI